MTNADLYIRISSTEKEMLAFVAERDFDWIEVASLSSASLLSGEAFQETDVEKPKSGEGILPVLDPCGMTVVLDRVLLKMLPSAWTCLHILRPSLTVHDVRVVGR